MIIYNTIIIGAGPAGLTAAIYAARRAMKTLMIGEEVGGQINKTFTIENYPGIKTIGGSELALNAGNQVKELGVEIITGRVNKITKENNLFIISEKETGATYQAKTLILSFGLKKRQLGLLGEEKFDGHGLSYCVNCDGPLFKNKNVAVVGGGNSGAEAVEFLAKICPTVYWLEIMPDLKADPVLIQQIRQLNNVKIFIQTKITALKGDPWLTNIVVDHEGQTETLTVQGIFVEIGYIAETDWLKGVVELDNAGQIKVDALGSTNVPGIFAAGDVTNSKHKQIVVASGAGAIAALEAYEYLRKQN